MSIHSKASIGFVTALLLSGCLERELKPLNPCLVSGVVAEVAVSKIEKIDLLFVVDDSNSMRQEQQALRNQFPRLIDALTSGQTPSGQQFAPVTDLHLGVVSTDMGLVGIQGVGGCEGLGDDGILQNTANPELPACQAAYPPFLTYTAGVNEAAQTASDFGCIASLGTEGCGFEQPLEAGLKALWPSVDRDASGAVMEPNRIRFLGDVDGSGQLGHGDTHNAGFVRNDPVQGLSLIAVILVTDEEDCSSADTTHFTPKQFLDPSNPLVEQDLNLRCFHNSQNLYAVERYVDGLKALRPGAEHLVVFGAIVGVPPDLVDGTARGAVDFGDDEMRDAHYQRILDDPRMQEVPDPDRTEKEGGNLTISCKSNMGGTAFPPRRIVEVARRFGTNGIVQSICQDDFSTAMDAILELLAGHLTVCLPRKLVRNSEGIVGCNVLWELPPPGSAPVTTPTACSDVPFLEPLDGEAASVSDSGGKICKVRQLQVAGGTAPAQSGWYYDDFSDEVIKLCPDREKQRITFSEDADPPTGVVVKLECLNQIQALPEIRVDAQTGPGVYAPTIGQPCDNVLFEGVAIPRAIACDVKLADPHAGDNGVDHSMFCHPALNVCVMGCRSDADCPSAWICDDRADTVASSVGLDREGGSPICVNPTCGDSAGM